MDCLCYIIEQDCFKACSILMISLEELETHLIVILIIHDTVDLSHIHTFPLQMRRSE